MRTPHWPSIHFHSVGSPSVTMPSVSPRAMWEAALRLLHSPGLRIRPRPALLSGSTFVLLSLFVPVAFNACGANHTGREFLMGEGYWPGMATVIQDGIERGAYGLGLGLAAFTLVLLLATVRRPAALHRDWIRWPYLVAGLLCVFAVFDYASLNVAEPVGDLISSATGVDRPEIIVPFMNALAILIMALCLRSKFVRQQGWMVWAFGIEIGVCWAVIVLSVRAQLGLPEIMPMDGVAQLAITPAILYWIVPMGLWIRFGLSHNDARRAQWQRLRPKVMMIYIPAWIIAGILLMMPAAWPLWGIAPYLAGLSLIFLGYTELAHVETSSASAAAMPASEQPAAQVL